MRTRDWTYTQAREYLATPATVMRYVGLIAQVSESMAPAESPSATPEPDPATGWGA